MYPPSSDIHIYGHIIALVTHTHMAELDEWIECAHANIYSILYSVHASAYSGAYTMCILEKTPL